MISHKRKIDEDTKHGENKNKKIKINYYFLIKLIEDKNKTENNFINILLNNNININNISNEFSNNLLISAFMYNEHNLIYFLLDNGYDINKKDSFSKDTILHMFAQNNRIDILYKLLKYKSLKISKNSQNISPIEIAVRRGFNDFANCLVKNLNCNIDNVLFNSVITGNNDLSISLLNNTGCNLNKFSNTVIKHIFESIIINDRNIEVFTKLLFRTGDFEFFFKMKMSGLFCNTVEKFFVLQNFIIKVVNYKRSKKIRPGLQELRNKWTNLNYHFKFNEPAIISKNGIVLYDGGKYFKTAKISFNQTNIKISYL